jgi:hypothetical protein
MSAQNDRNDETASLKAVQTSAQTWKDCSTLTSAKVQNKFVQTSAQHAMSAKGDEQKTFFDWPIFT